MDNMDKKPVINKLPVSSAFALDFGSVPVGSSSSSVVGASWKWSSLAESLSRTVFNVPQTDMSRVIMNGTQTDFCDRHLGISRMLADSGSAILGS